MGKIRGDVEAVGISNLLQMFSLGGCQGVLTVYRNFQRKVLQFGPGGMRVMTAGAKQTHPLGEIMVRSERITAAQLEGLLAEQKQSRKHLGLIMVEKGILSAEELHRVLEEHIAEEIYELFTWTGATFEYTGTHGEAPARGETPLSEITVDADVTSAILEASRLADELARIQKVIDDVRMIPVRLSEIPVERDGRRLTTEILLAVLPLLDGKRSVSQIIEASGYPKFRVLGALDELLQRGSLEIRDTSGDTTVRRPRPVRLPCGPPGSRTVLVLGETPEGLRARAAALRTAGFTVREGQASGDLASCLGEGRVDAIVLDVEIETQWGRDACGRLRAATSVPFVAFCREATRESVARAAESGARFVFLKPAREELLVGRLWELVRD